MRDIFLRNMKEIGFSLNIRKVEGRVKDDFNFFFLYIQKKGGIFNEMGNEEELSFVRFMDLS